MRDVEPAAARPRDAAPRPARVGDARDATHRSVRSSTSCTAGTGRPDLARGIVDSIGSVGRGVVWTTSWSPGSSTPVGEHELLAAEERPVPVDLHRQRTRPAHGTRRSPSSRPTLPAATQTHLARPGAGAEQPDVAHEVGPRPQPAVRAGTSMPAARPAGRARAAPARRPRAWRQSPPHRRPVPVAGRPRRRGTASVTPGAPEPARELDVLARGQLLVEPAAPLDDRSPEAEVAAVRELEHAEELPGPDAIARPRVSSTQSGFSVVMSSGPVTSSWVAQPLAHRAHPAGVRRRRRRRTSRSRPARASRMPTLRQCATPGPVGRVDEPDPRVRLRVLARRSAGVASVEPLSTTTSSHGRSHSWREQRVELVLGSWPPRPGPGSRRSARASRLAAAPEESTGPIDGSRKLATRSASACSKRDDDHARGRPPRGPRRRAPASHAAAVPRRGRRSASPSASAHSLDRRVGRHEPAAAADGLAQRGEVAGEHRDAVRLRFEDDARPAVEQEGREQHPGVGVDRAGSVVAGRSTTFGSFAASRVVRARPARRPPSFHHSTNANCTSGRAAASSSAVSSP